MISPERFKRMIRPKDVGGANFRHVMSGRHVTDKPFVDAVWGPFKERPPASRSVIGGWEAKAYVDMELEKLARDAEEHGFTVGRTEASREALRKVGQDLMKGIRERNIVIED